MTEDHPIVLAFIEAAKQTLSTMAMMELEIESVEMVTVLDATLDYTATMGLCGGDEGEGLLLLTLGEDVAAQVISAMLGVDPAEAGDDLVDGVGEIANMIAGAAKTTVVCANIHFDHSIPAVMKGGKSQVVSGGGDAGARVNCSVRGLPLVMCIWMQGIVE